MKHGMKVYVAAVLSAICLVDSGVLAVDYSAESLLQLRLRHTEIEFVSGQLHECISKVEAKVKEQFPWVTGLPVKVIPGSPMVRMNQLDFGKRPAEKISYDAPSLGELLAAIATLNGYMFDVNEGVIEFRPADASGSYYFERIYALESKAWRVLKFDEKNQAVFFERMNDLGVELKVKFVDEKRGFIVFFATRRDLDLLDQIIRLAELDMLK